MDKLKNHPVWEVYNQHRDCRLNIHYWSKKFARLRRINLIMEYLVMVTAPGSAVTGLVFWKTDYGKVVWTILITLTALVSLGKPFLKLSDRMANLQNIITHYKSLANQLEELGNDIRRENNYTPLMVSTFKSVERHLDRITALEPIEEIDTDLQQLCFERVNNELPEAKFHVPGE